MKNAPRSLRFMVPPTAPAGISARENLRRCAVGWLSGLAASGLLLVMLLMTGCSAVPTYPPAADSSAPPASVASPAGNPDAAALGAQAGLPLTAGDMIRVTFGVETNLNTTAKIQLDGQVALPLVGDVPAAGKTVAELKADLTQRYQRFLKDDEVSVSLATSSASVYVTGAVLRPGRIPMDRPLTALEAIMEAGGFDPRANSSSVTVLRLENGQQRRHRVDLGSALKGNDPLPFWLKPFDIINVPERRFNF